MARVPTPEMQRKELQPSEQQQAGRRGKKKKLTREVGCYVVSAAGKKAILIITT